MAHPTHWAKMSIQERITAATIDITRSPEFCKLSGVVCAGKVDVLSGTGITAGTDGLNVFYGEEFMLQRSVEEVRWVVLHENNHKALKHCTHYRDLVDKYPHESNLAQDFEINLMIYDMDPTEKFAKRPAGVEICFDEKYRGMSWIAILRSLIKPKDKEPDQGRGQNKGQQQGQGQGQGQSPSQGNGQRNPQPFDKHIRNKRSNAAIEKVDKVIGDALHQGEIIAAKHRAGGGKGGKQINTSAAQRNTQWRSHLQQFVTNIITGDEQSRFCPPNKRLLPLGFIMPTHFSEAAGGLIIAGDTSSSMGSIYPVLLGEITRVCQIAKPEWVRVLWWDTKVCGDQLFKPEQYADIGKLLKPAGGGGTEPRCVSLYIVQKQYTPKGIVWLTDGEFFSTPAPISIPQIWGVVDNEKFVPSQGKVVHINSLDN